MLDLFLYALMFIGLATFSVCMTVLMCYCLYWLKERYDTRRG